MVTGEGTLVTIAPASLVKYLDLIIAVGLTCSRAKSMHIPFDQRRFLDADQQWRARDSVSVLKLQWK